LTSDLGRLETTLSNVQRAVDLAAESASVA
jgi:hypothetical protein